MQAKAHHVLLKTILLFENLGGIWPGFQIPGRICQALTIEVHV